MLFRKNRKTFRLRIDRKQAELERKLFESEPDAVKAELKTCKTFMIVFIPIGAALSFLSEISIFVPFFAGFVAASFIAVRLKSGASRKLTFVPAVCLVTGFLLGQFILRKPIATILG